MGSGGGSSPLSERVKQVLADRGLSRLAHVDAARLTSALVDELGIPEAVAIVESFGEPDHALSLARKPRARLLDDAQKARMAEVVIAAGQPFCAVEFAGHVPGLDASRLDRLIDVVLTEKLEWRPDAARRFLGIVDGLSSGQRARLEAAL